MIFLFASVMLFCITMSLLCRALSLGSGLQHPSSVWHERRRFLFRCKRAYTVILCGGLCNLTWITVSICGDDGVHIRTCSYLALILAVLIAGVVSLRDLLLGYKLQRIKAARSFGSHRLPQSRRRRASVNFTCLLMCLNIMSAHAVGVHANIQLAIQANGSSHVAFDSEATLFQYRPPPDKSTHEDPDLT